MLMKNILVIDTDIDYLTIMKLTLSSEDQNVKVFSNWKDGYSNIVASQPSLIIMAVELKTADGRNLAMNLKDNPVTKNIPVILISADRSIKPNMQDYDVAEFLYKPIDITYFIRKVKTLIAA